MSQHVTHRDSRIEVYTQEPMVNWLGAGQLVQTGIRSLVAGTFGLFADSRIVQAALNPPSSNPPLTPCQKDTTWIDYVADVGDGWDSTYSVAWSISREELSVTGIEQPLPRADMLVLGGDQVYPTPAGNRYRTRFLDPYRSAFPADIPSSTQARETAQTEAQEQTGSPVMLAIPGNHDWYDGLHGFTQIFCGQRPIGRWRTVQRTSYFAAQLPHGWWLWGIDLQLESEIDRPQLDYFQWIAREHLKAGDRVVLCTPEPSWIDESERLRQDQDTAKDNAAEKRTEAIRRLRAIETQNPRFRSLREVEQIVAHSGKGKLAAVLTGDLHLYAHYVPEPQDHCVPHRFICGGGGAFLLGTHSLPQQLHFRSNGEQRYQRGAMFPDGATSRRLRNQAWMLPWRNTSFCVVLAAIYLLYVWVLQSASKVPSVALSGKSLMEYLAQVPFSLHHVITTLPVAVLNVMVHSPASVVLTSLIVGGTAAFTASGVKRGKILAALGGAVHGLLHLFLALLLLWAMGGLNLVELHMPVDSFKQVSLFVGEALLLGGALGGILFGLWLVLTNMWFGWHHVEVFSSQHIADFKSFLRMRIDEAGLTIYPLGIRRVCRRWRVGAGIEPLLRAANTWKLRAFRGNGARFEPQEAIPVELIDQPLHIPSTDKEQA